MKALDRRAFLRSSAGAGAGALWLLACGDAAAPADPDALLAGPDAPPGPLDAAGCRVSTADAIGPYYRAGAPARTVIAGPDEPGTRFTLAGTILADDCVTPVVGALVDVWQADATGAYHEPGRTYRLRGQVTTHDQGQFFVETIQPGNYSLGAGLWRPAHVHLTVTHPGFASLTTQIYFAGDPYLPPNDGCSTCASDDPARIVTLDEIKGSLVASLDLVLARR